MEESTKFSDDFSSVSVLSDGWQELDKFDFAQVIFSDLFYDANSNRVGCKFHISDNFHEDPCDFLGLYHVGYNDLSQCLVFKFLSETKCEDEKKLKQCAFNLSAVPHLEDGFYQFLYVTCDKELYGASVPFEIKRAQNQPKEESLDVEIAEKVGDEFLFVSHGIERKNQILEDFMEKYQLESQNSTFKLEKLRNSKDIICNEIEDIIVSLNEKVLSLESQNMYSESQMSNKINVMKKLNEEIEKYKVTCKELQQKHEKLQGDYSKQSEELKQYKKFYEEHKEKQMQINAQQLEDQLHWTENLENSNQFTLKEISDLFEPLSQSTLILNSTKEKLAKCQEKLNDAATAQEKQNEEIRKLCIEVNDLRKTVEEKNDALETKSLKIEILEREIENLRNKEKQLKAQTNEVGMKRNCSFAETSNKIRELSSVLIEMNKNTNFDSLSESKLFYTLKIQLLNLLSQMGRPIDEKNVNQPNPSAELE
ncbi:SKICH domain-containing protein [Nephila pilipes]|uniref:SKICH domain-containing protein n=1 Tax=Nephila pilipes TaxID=299642 RepID=A0A8X6P812_NEPPI|nr:SKICH domain-containing protein [Nephila pilipes]